MSEKILIIEDDNDINSLLKDAFSKAGYECTQAFSGTEGFLQLKMNEFSLIILDLMLPGMTGEELLEKIKPDNPTPVIVLSAKDELDSKVALLNRGAEDYITKPFEIKELIARAQVQIRRNSRTEESKTLKHKEMVFSKTDFTVAVCGVEISLTRQEMKILELMLTHPAKVFSKQEIYSYAWDDIYIGEDKTINVHISNIRQKIKAVTDDEYIETVWGVGFRLAK
ncbi:MAG: response regulator transcription factor [Hominimerdicola sp.]